MIRRLFLDHPHAVGETYPQHMHVAARVGAMMIAGGIAALIHGLFPRLHERTASRMIRRLNAEMIGRQPSEAEIDGFPTQNI